MLKQHGAETCNWCDAVLSLHQAVATKCCGAPACERARMVDLAKSETQRHLDDHDDLVARMRNQTAEALKEAAVTLQSDEADLQVAVVPYNDKALTVLPAERRVAF